MNLCNIVLNTNIGIGEAGCFLCQKNSTAINMLILPLWPSMTQLQAAKYAAEGSN